MKLDSELLSAYIARFLGFGNPASDIWFVGMEEGGGSTFDDVFERLRAWDLRGRVQFEHIADYHRAHDQYPWFRSDRSATQSTWRALIRVALARHGKPEDLESIRSYQFHAFARPGGLECLLELSPLPSPGLGEWYYDEFSSIPELASRARYAEAWFGKRRALIAEQLSIHRPKCVVFYGIGYLAEWEAIIATPFAKTDVPGVMAANGNGTRYVCIRHPANERRKSYFADVGLFLRNS